MNFGFVYNSIILNNWHTNSGNDTLYISEKLQRFESLLIKCKENIKTQKERIAQLQTDNESIKRSEMLKQNELDQLKVSFIYYQHVL